MIYLDTSALAKLVLTEAETPALSDWLDDRSEVPRVSSSLARVELVRAVRAEGDAAIRTATLVLVELDEMPMTTDLLDAAGALAFPLKSLDAIHLASALRIRVHLDAFVAYDKRLLTAADEMGLPIASPGTAEPTT
ncbi:VapC toxin family PIN domain ribonuclease [Saccharothrix sp. ALI-22-I]|uniref:type II toxin-antitoxin system VapC family toxin n=1 Tax=Saccharothrix sp. ALI-22-I TaxID=1933778 RepID=UPI00097C2D40|nr:type II toxin-antitoxin system VapC family toxin [Saccharothrix sp. ALI-22-I]ONI88368.1 VapC toxin family PIN domain ribonuclease [Saccharothrix sp. ALI-22-I]